eukprot:scaffold91892_cov26-Tisochrysis_lutea.AAC.4
MPSKHASIAMGVMRRLYFSALESSSSSTIFSTVSSRAMGSVTLVHGRVARDVGPLLELYEYLPPMAPLDGLAQVRERCDDKVRHLLGQLRLKIRPQQLPEGLKGGDGGATAAFDHMVQPLVGSKLSVILCVLAFELLCIGAHPLKFARGTGRFAKRCAQLGCPIAEERAPHVVH